MSEFEDIGPGQHIPKPGEKVIKKARDFYNRRDVRQTVEKAERLLKVAKDVKSGNPFSIAHGLFKTAEILYDFQESSQSPALKKYHELLETSETLCSEAATSLAVSFLDCDRVETIESSSSESGSVRGPTLYRYVMDNGTPLYWFQDKFEYLSPLCSSSDVDDVRNFLLQGFWEEYGSEVEMSWNDSREFGFREKTPQPWEYQGDFGVKLIQRWKRAFELDVRRFIILHGPPGTGKTTLVRQFGKELENARVLYVPTQTLLDANSIQYFSDVLDLLSPDVVIIDDFDRLPRADMDRLLSFFEETSTQIPLLLATTNHLDKIPGSIKRPGRFDEIWEIAPPPPDVRPQIIQYLAEKEGIVLQEHQVSIISNICGKKRLSGAHIREILRRLKLEDVDPDWETMDFDSRDLTFSTEWRPEDYQPEGVVYESVVYEEDDDWDDDDWDDDDVWDEEDS